MDSLKYPAAKIEFSVLCCLLDKATGYRLQMRVAQ